VAQAPERKDEIQVSAHPR